MVVVRVAIAASRPAARIVRSSCEVVLSPQWTPAAVKPAGTVI